MTFRIRTLRTALAREVARRTRAATDLGQTALVLVVALTVLISTVGIVMVSNVVENSPILSTVSIQRYAYRALDSGLNAYQSAVNADPYLAACNQNTNPSTATPAGSNPTAQCAGIAYDSWSEVPGTNAGNGVVPEYYKFDNPQEVTNATTNALQYLEVQIVGAAGYSGRYTYYSTVARFVPANGFLDNVWWTNYEAYGATPSQCTYYWNGYTDPTNCGPVYFAGGDNVYGPIFSNDSIYVDGPANFGPYAVTTADPSCQFVEDGTTVGSNNLGQPPSGGNQNCGATASDLGITYSAATSTHSAKNYEPIPTDNQQLLNFAEQGGCLYDGPTQITLTGSTMTVVSPNTPSSGGYATTASAYASNTNQCPVDGSGSLPSNGVVYVDNGCDNATTACAGANPFDGVVVNYSCGTRFHPATCQKTIDNQTALAGSNPATDPACSGCYYGQTSTPDSEGDAFVQGSLSGHLTIGAHNDVIVDGAVTYADCTWVGTPSQSNCKYNAQPAVNDSLGLIAYNFVEIDRPVDSAGGNILANCDSGNNEPAPLCDPAGSGSGGLIVDASILALQHSFGVNNYSLGGYEGYLNVYGSIQQDSRGIVATGGGGGISTGYAKYYLWDPRLALYSPPYYLTPGTPSWNLDSSSESYSGVCPDTPPVDAAPSSTAPTFPSSVNPLPTGWSYCTGLT